MVSNFLQAMKRYMYIIMAAAAVLASCTKAKTDNTIPDSSVSAEDAEYKTIGASTDAATKAYVDSEDNTQVLWDDFDGLSVYGDYTNDHYSTPESDEKQFILIDGKGTCCGTFFIFEPFNPRICKINAIVSNIPWGDQSTYHNYDFSSKVLTCTIPTVQYAVKGSFDPKAVVMYSREDIDKDNVDDIKLNYAVNFLKLTLTETVKSVIIKGDEPLTGRIDITESGISAASEDTKNYVELTGKNGALIEPGDYYIAVRPCDIHNPVITYKGAHSYKTKAGKGTLSFAAGKNVKPISVDWTTGDVKGAVQLWADGPYWSIKNIGAANEYDPGYYFSWGNTIGYVHDSAINQWKVAPGYPNAGTVWNGGFNLNNYLGTHGQSLQRSLQANAADDAAVAAWGSDWRMPTKAEVDGFDGNITSTLSADAKYMKVNGKGDYINDYIILPIAGLGNDNLNQETQAHWSWTSTFSQRSGTINRSYQMLVSKKYPTPHPVISVVSTYGMNIRPVLVNTQNY